MRRHWPAVAICLAWLIAGVTIFLSGKWIGSTRADGPSYSQCKPIEWTGRVGWLCFPDEPAPAPVSEGGEA